MPSPIKQQSLSTAKLNKSKSPSKSPRQQSSKTKTSSLILPDLPDDILVKILNMLDIFHLIKVYSTNTYFTKKKLVL